MTLPTAGPPAEVVVHSVRLVDRGQIVDDAWVVFRDGRVALRGAGARGTAEANVSAFDGTGHYLVPGFIDLHGHGGGGFSFDDGPAAIAKARSFHRSHGTTRAVLSQVTAPLGDLVARLAVVTEAMRADASILGSHLEGPFLDLAHKGAHTGSMLIAPDPGSVERLIDAGGGSLRQVTLAPELPGGLAAVSQFAAAGVAVAVGHTGASAQEAQAAFDAGATLLTHAFNAMPGIHHRAPGPVVAAMRDPRVVLEIIADGVHVHPSVIALAFAAAGGRIALITDAMAAAGAPDGDYTLGGLAVTVVDGVARLDADGTIAGSTLTQDAALRCAVGCGIPLPDAVAALTATPARALGLADRYGSLAPGSAADAVLLADDLTVREVWTGGVREGLWPRRQPKG